MKQQDCEEPEKKSQVMPHVGMWIETVYCENTLQINTVMPHVGMWIETYRNVWKSFWSKVMPHVGMWIEKYFLHKLSQTIKGNASRRNVDRNKSSCKSKGKLG